MVIMVIVMVMVMVMVSVRAVGEHLLGLGFKVWLGFRLMAMVMGVLVLVRVRALWLG